MKIKIVCSVWKIVDCSDGDGGTGGGGGGRQQWCTVVVVYIITQLSYVELRYPGGNTVHTTSQPLAEQKYPRLPGIKYIKSKCNTALDQFVFYNVAVWQIIFI